jgi:hypothetical protein
MPATMPATMPEPTFTKDPNYYNRHFPFTDIIGVTEKAYHFRVKDLDFWFPRSQVHGVTETATSKQVFAYAPFWRKSIEEAILAREEAKLQEDLLSPYLSE